MFKELFLTQSFVLVSSLLMLSVPITAKPQGSPVKQSSKQQHDPLIKNRTRTFFGEAKKLGNGTIHSWVKLDRTGSPISIGATFTEDALTGLPVELPADQFTIEYPLVLPSQASKTPFTHLVVNWNPMGHPPERIYDIGHFDFHFYQIPERERAAITARGDDLEICRKQPPAEFIPEDYLFAPGSEVPRMGAHWVDKMAHEFHGHTFTATLGYGSYNGSFIFIEPMITKKFFETRPNYSASIKLPIKYAKAGYYPTSYSVKYNRIRKEYTVALNGLTKREVQTSLSEAGAQ